MEPLSQVSQCGHCSTEIAPPKLKFCSDKCRKASHYKNNRAYYAQKYKDHYYKRRDALNEIKVKAGCRSCGYNAHPAALEFNHLDPKTKLGNIAEKLASWSWEKIQKEIDKCEVLCSNCHHIHSYDTHYTRMGNL